MFATLNSNGTFSCLPCLIGIYPDGEIIVIFINIHPFWFVVNQPHIAVIVYFHLTVSTCFYRTYLIRLRSQIGSGVHNVVVKRYHSNHYDNRTYYNLFQTTTFLLRLSMLNLIIRAWSTNIYKLTSIICAEIHGVIILSMTFRTFLHISIIIFFFDLLQPIPY